MAGTFTHFMVAEQAIALLKRQDGASTLAKALEERASFVFQGSISPDYPFIAERLPGPLRRKGNWGTRMHGENTGAMIDSGLRLLQLRQGDDRDICLAWLFGHASHLVADALIHPIVNLAVGGVAFCTEEDHGFCEITQDAWIVRTLKGVDVANSGYLEELRKCSHPRDGDRIHPSIDAFWRCCLKGAHPLAGKEHRNIRPSDWHDALLDLLRIAVRPGKLKYIGSIAGLGNRLYKPLAEIPSVQLEAYVEALRVPDGTSAGTRRTTFREVFDKAVSEVVVVWQRMAADLAALEADPKHDPARYPNWDLETGVQMPTWEDGRYEGLNRLALWA